MRDRDRCQTYLGRPSLESVVEKPPLDRASLDSCHSALTISSSPRLSLIVIDYFSDD